MPRNITVTFADGTSHVYQNAPDDVTPDSVSARAQKEFGKTVFALDGGRAAPAAPKPIPERTYGEAATDVAGKLISGTGSLVQLPGQLYGLATGDFSKTGLLGAGEDIQKYGESMLSPALKAKEEARAQKIAESEKTGQLAAAGTAFSETVKDPALLVGFLVEQFANQMLRRTNAGRAIGKAWICLGVSEELLQRRDRRIFRHNQTHGALVNQRDWHEVCDRIVAQAGHRHGVRRMRGRIAERQRIAVLRSPSAKQRAY